MNNKKIHIRANNNVLDSDAYRDRISKGNDLWFNSHAFL